MNHLMCLILNYSITKAIFEEKMDTLIFDFILFILFYTSNIILHFMLNILHQSKGLHIDFLMYIIFPLKYLTVLVNGGKKMLLIIYLDSYPHQPFS